MFVLVSFCHFRISKKESVGLEMVSVRGEFMKRSEENFDSDVLTFTNGSKSRKNTHHRRKSLQNRR